MLSVCALCFSSPLSASSLIPQCFIELVLSAYSFTVFSLFPSIFLSCWAPGSGSLHPPSAGPWDIHYWDQVYRQRPWRQILFQCDRWSCAQRHCGCPGRSHLHPGRFVDEWKIVCLKKEEGKQHCYNSLSYSWLAPRIYWFISRVHLKKYRFFLYNCVAWCIKSIHKIFTVYCMYI